jgi:hypothetical protein
MVVSDEVDSVQVDENHPVTCGVPYEVNHYHANRECQYVRRAIIEGRVDVRVQQEDHSVDLIDYHDLDLCSECQRKNAEDGQ